MYENQELQIMYLDLEHLKAQFSWDLCMYGGVLGGSR